MRLICSENDACGNAFRFADFILSYGGTVRRRGAGESRRRFSGYTGLQQRQIPLFLAFFGEPIIIIRFYDRDKGGKIVADNKKKMVDDITPMDVDFAKVY